ncbi:MAG TPA: M14 family zinc carboxypeptidase [Acidobacteriaceae bacterium]|nr:M14 family zinc carboxypeptidase [Acidobacteriaceae bacterium]
MMRRILLFSVFSALLVSSFHAVRAQIPAALDAQFARDQQQPVDTSYTAAINKYTTEPYFNSPLTDYLPASKTVPTPKAVLGDVAGAPRILPYAETVYKYFRLLQASTPRVRVYTIGHSEEGRERIVAAIADKSLLDQLDANNARLAQLGDPRTPGMTSAKAAQLVSQSFPVYYITGTIHSVETGAPTALMELAYRLAVDNSPYIRYIRSHMVVLITPVVEVDGRDRMVDLYKWHLAHKGENWPHLLYWGHYVAHDNNRDAMGMTLDLTRNVLDTYLRFHALVLHDLHESVPFLYDNTVGDGPYNSWIDPILADEWADIGWNNVAAMENFGMPGVFTHGDFDTWSPGYLMFLAAMHNGISRLYETFGNGGADTERRILDPDEYARTWYKQNPPLPSVMWSQRDNNNYEETALLTTLSYFAQHGQHFLTDYYLKSKRSVDKPENAGPAAYVFAAKPAYRNRQMQLLHVMQLQHVEISRLTAPATVMVSVSERAAAKDEDAGKQAEKDGSKSGNAKSSAGKKTPETFPVGSYVIRMDQPFSRVADALLDRQYWAPNDPQRHPYDDTGWSFSEIFNADVTRVTDTKILSAPMERVKNLTDASQSPASGSGPVYAVNNTGQIGLLALAYAVPGARLHVLDEAVDAGGEHLAAGSLLIEKADANKMTAALRKLDLRAVTLQAMPSAHMHAIVSLPRIAFMHTWLSTQTEGWWREAFDFLGVPYSYISTQTVSQETDIRSKYDVIVFAPVSSRISTKLIISGLPMWGNPLPWEKTALTPNLGRIDSTPDMRPGLGYDGVEHLRQFVKDGGLLITSEDTAKFAIDIGLAPGVSIAPKRNVKVAGSILGAVVVEPGKNPVTYGYDKQFAVYSASGMAFNVSDVIAGGRRLPTAKTAKRVTGRGGPDDTDMPEARPPVTPPALPDVKPWQAIPLNVDQARNNPYLIPKALRPDVLVRFAGARQLLLSGLLDHPEPIAERAVVVDAHVGTGNVLLFGINPIYRGETIGDYALVFNAILNHAALR